MKLTWEVFAVCLIVGGAAAAIHFGKAKPLTVEVNEKLDVIEKRDASEKQDIQDLMKEYARIETVLIQEHERRAAQQREIKSMYIPSYLAGC